MKSKFLYIILALMAAAVIALFITNRQDTEKKLDERLSFRKRDKIPYGTRVAYESLQDIFPNATLLSEKSAPGLWDSLWSYRSGQALIIVSPVFFPDEYEMNELIDFAKAGNQLFISALRVSEEVESKLRFQPAYTNVLETWGMIDDADTLSFTLMPPLTSEKTVYSYPGKRMETWLNKWDTSVTQVLGYSESGRPNLVRMSVGKGNLYFHLAPMSFTNYFLLHKNNLSFYEQVMSVIPAATRLIVWDEYFITKRNRNTDNDNKKGWFSVFMKHRALRWALLTVLFALLLYVLMEMRRKQRPIPVVKPPKNDSLDFVKTIGRLYYDKADHKNLARKMSAYFLEYVRNRYKLSTAELNDEFVKNLQYKSGVSQEQVLSVVYLIKNVEEMPEISDKMLAELHKQLESFYKNA